MKYRPDDDFRKHLNEQGLRGKRFKLDSVEHLELVDKFRDWHPNETPEELHQRAAYALLWKDKKKHNTKWYLKWLAIGIGLLLLILGASSRAEAQVDCVKWQASDSSTVGNFCAPFKVKAGSNVTFSKSGTTLTVDVSSGASTPPFIDVVHTCGLVGDGVTDDSAALATCFANHGGGAHFYFPQTNFANGCSYKFLSSILPTAVGTVIEGASASFRNSTTSLAGTVLCFPAGVTGINLSSGAAGCGGCTIKNIALLGSEGTNQLQAPTALNIPSSDNLPQTVRSISSIQRASNVLTVTVTRIVGSEGLTQQVGSTVKITGVVGDASLNGLCDVATLTGNTAFGDNPNGFTCAQNGADSGPFTNDGTLKLPTTGTSTADGIKVCNNFNNIYNVVIQSFGRHGVNADSNAGNGCASAFSDDLIMRDSFLNGNQGNGYYCSGVDCNAHILTGNAIYYNVMWGIEDQSSLGNTYVGNQISNNSHFWWGSATPATKNITSVTRASSAVAVVLASADTNIKLGSCVVIAGVTDTTFNTAAGQCFFITSYTNSTHYAYIQPGNPGDATSSGGTSRMAKALEAYLSSGIDDGAMKIQTQSAVAQAVVVSNYVEGGQYCKWGSNTISIGGPNVPVCATGGFYAGNFITTQGCTGMGGTLCLSSLGVWSNNDVGTGVEFKGGKTVASPINIDWLNYDTTRAFRLNANVSGTNGSTGYLHLTADGTGQTRLVIFGQGTNSGSTDLSAEGSGAVRFNRNFAGTNAGTGGVEFYSGGASPAKVSSIDSAGKGTFNGGLSVATGVSQNTGIKHGRVTTGSIGAGLSAAVTLTWGGTAFADTSYTVNCSVLEATTSTSTIRVHHIESVSTTNTVVRLVNDDGANARTGTLECQAFHD